MLNQQKTRLKQKTITAPFAGQMGIRQVNLGQYVAPGKTLVTLQAMQPLHVFFHMPEQALVNLHLQQPIEVTVNNGNDQHIQGMITAINAKVDSLTRTVLVEATISNDQNQYYPGMYGLVRILLQERHDTIVIPQTAIGS